MADNETEEKIIRTFSEKGPGRKQCPACSTYIGVRSLVCVCGHEFVKAKTPTVSAPTKTVVQPAARQAAPSLKSAVLAAGSGGARRSLAEIQREAQLRKQQGGPTRAPTEGSSDSSDSEGEIEESGLEQYEGRLEESSDEVPAALKHRDRRNVLTTPAGKCPVLLTGTDRDTVWEWAKTVQGKTYDILAVSALIYWANQKFNRLTDREDHEVVADHLRAYGQAYRVPDGSI